MWKEMIQARFAEAVFKKVRPHVIQFVEVDVLTSPLFEAIPNRHDLSHELVHTVVIIA
jgi:hypothetical protein